MSLNPKMLVPQSLRNKVRVPLVHYCFDHVYPRLYRKTAREAVDPRKVVFVEANRDEPSDSLQLVYNEMKRRGFVCEFASLHWNCGKFSEYTKCSAQMVQMVATARYVFICEACHPLACVPLRPETTVIQLWHGCGAFKKFGMSTADKIFGDSRKEQMRNPAHHNTSLVTVSSPEVIWAYEEAMNLEGTGVVQPLGVSRTDVYFDRSYIECESARVCDVVPSAKNKKVLLYAPTFRGRVGTAEAPDQLDIQLLKQRLGAEWILLIKHHPHVKKRPQIPDGCKEFAFDITDSLSIEACLCRADACITDYSSLVFEYALLERPMAFFAYDLDDYDDWRGFYYEYDELTPGPVLKTTEQIADWVASLQSEFDPSEVIAFKNKFMSACDGHATERILDAAEHLSTTSASPDLTVIVPVYNAESYLKRCVASLDAQTASQDTFEVVLINDGSIDNSLTLCKEVVSAHKNYVLIDQANAGVSAARNAGIRAARGRYLMFLDCDDEVSPTTVQKLVETFDHLGESCDLVAYELIYHDEETGEEHPNVRSKWLTKTGLYDLEQYPFVAQTSINTCIRNQSKATPLFEEGRAHSEDQLFITNMLCKKNALGYCAEARYVYHRVRTSTTMQRDVPEQSFDDVMHAFEAYIEMGEKNPQFALYTHQLVLYNVRWRMREHKLLPEFGSKEERVANNERLGKVLRAIPPEHWMEAPRFSDTLRYYLMERYGVEVDEAAFRRVEGVLDWMVYENGHLDVRGHLYGPRLLLEQKPTLVATVNGEQKKLDLSPSSYNDEGTGVALTNAWSFGLCVPAAPNTTCSIAFEFSTALGATAKVVLRYELKRTNGAKVSGRIRQFSQTVTSLQGNTLYVGTVRGAPAIASPVALKLARQKDAKSSASVKTIMGLRKRVVRKLEGYAKKEIWLFADVPTEYKKGNAYKAYLNERGAADGIERHYLRQNQSVEDVLAEVFAAHRIVATTYSLMDLIPRESSHWEYLADLATPCQQWEIVCDSFGDGVKQ